MENAGAEARSRRYRISSDFVLRKIAGEYAIIPLGETKFFANAMMVPNPSAAFLWQAFSEPSTEEDVVQRVLDRFDGEEADIRRDVAMFIREMLEKQVLVEVD